MNNKFEKNKNQILWGFACLLFISNFLFAADPREAQQANHECTFDSTVRNASGVPVLRVRFLKTPWGDTVVRLSPPNPGDYSFAVQYVVSTRNGCGTTINLNILDLEGASAESAQLIQQLLQEQVRRPNTTVVNETVNRKEALLYLRICRSPGSTEISDAVREITDETMEAIARAKRPVNDPRATIRPRGTPRRPTSSILCEARREPLEAMQKIYGRNPFEIEGAGGKGSRQCPNSGKPGAGAFAWAMFFADLAAPQVEKGVGWGFNKCNPEYKTLIGKVTSSQPIEQGFLRGRRASGFDWLLEGSSFTDSEPCNQHIEVWLNDFIGCKGEGAAALKLEVQAKDQALQSRRDQLYNESFIPFALAGFKLGVNSGIQCASNAGNTLIRLVTPSPSTPKVPKCPKKLTERDGLPMCGERRK